MHSNKIEKYKNALKLTKKQREIIIGTLLGDGHMETQNNGRTYRLKIEHSLSQKDYVSWLYEQFKSWVLTAPQIKEQVVFGKKFKKFWFNTLSHGSFRFYAQQFYRDGKKIVPKLIHHWLTPLALAVWFMDDGSIKSKQHKARIFNTQGFSKPEVKRLSVVLKEKFGLETKLRKQPEGWQLMILAESSERFAELVKKYIHESMRYKLQGLG